MGWVKTVDKRELILNATEKCLRDRGLNRLNIRDVAKEAGVSLGSVHYYFPSKEHILMEIFSQFVNRVSKATLSRFPDADPEQVIMDFLDGFFAELGKDPGSCQVFIDLWEQISKHEDLRQLMDAYYRKSLGWLTELIASGKQKGHFNVDAPALLAAHIIAIIDGLKVQLHLFGPEIDLDLMKDACKNMIIKALH